MRIVLDTNVALSALLWRGTPYQLLQSLRRSEHVQIFSSPVLLTELGTVLARPVPTRRLALLGTPAYEVLTQYIRAIELVTPVSIPRAVAADPDDDHVIAAAIAAQADLVITGDKALLAVGRYEDIRIVSPAEAIGLIAGS